MSDGVMYNVASKSLHIFRVPGFHVIRRPIERNYHTAGLTVFNDTEDEHMLEVTASCGCFQSAVSTQSWSTDLRILTRGH